MFNIGIYLCVVVFFYTTDEKGDVNIKTRHNNQYYGTLDVDTILSDLDLDSRPQLSKKAKASVPVIEQTLELI